jgi:hypothetical protein
VLDTAPLTSVAEQLGDRLRRLPESALRRGAAAEGFALARELTRRAQLLEFPGSTPRELPDEGVLTVGDQLAVATHDLAEIVRKTGAAGELQEAAALVRDAAPRVAEAATARR